MLIHGDANNASIELSEQEGLAEPGGTEFYRVTLRENEFEASIRVYAFDPTEDGLPKFFASLGRDWKGWDGERRWSSLEGEFELRCEHDSTGHVITTATIRSNRYGHGWMGEIRFDIAGGKLDKIAAEVDLFFRKPAQTPA